MVSFIIGTYPYISGEHSKAAVNCKHNRTSVSVSIKAKFHYAIQVVDLVSDLAFDKFVRVCDQLATFLGRKQLADRFELSPQARFELVRELVCHWIA